MSLSTSSASGSLVASDSSGDEANEMFNPLSVSAAIPTSWQPFVTCSGMSGTTDTGSKSGSHWLLDDQSNSSCNSSLLSDGHSPSGNQSASSIWSSVDYSSTNPSPTPVGYQSTSLWTPIDSTEPDIWGRPVTNFKPNVGPISRPSLWQQDTNCRNRNTPRMENAFSRSNPYLLSNFRPSEDRVLNILRFNAVFLDNLHPMVCTPQGQRKLVDIFSKYGALQAIEVKPVLGITSTYACVCFFDHESPEKAVTDVLNDKVPMKMDLVFDLKQPLICKFAPGPEQRRQLSSGTLAWNWAKAMIERSGECFEWRFNSSCSAGRHCYRKHVVKHRCIDTLKSFSI